MTTITGQVTGDTAVIKRLQGLDARARVGLIKGLGRVALRLQAKIQTEKLTGQVLKVRTGTLRRSIAQVVIDGDTPTAVVSTNVKYARFHEFGFDGPMTVKAHLRRIRLAFGRPIAEKQVQVQTHTRQVKRDPRPFMRTALQELDAAGVIDSEISTQIRKAMESA